MYLLYILYTKYTVYILYAMYIGDNANIFFGTQSIRLGDEWIGWYDSI